MHTNACVWIESENSEPIHCHRDKYTFLGHIPKQ